MASRNNGGNEFGGFRSPRVEQYNEPIDEYRDTLLGRERGIQGDHNSCYLDSTLFAMFSFSR